MHLKYNKNPPEDTIPSVLLVNILSEWQLVNILAQGWREPVQRPARSSDSSPRKEGEGGGEGGEVGLIKEKELEKAS